MEQTRRSKLAPLPAVAIGTSRVAFEAVRVFLTFCRRKPLGGASAIVAVLLVSAAVFANVIAPYDPLQQFAGQTLKDPSTRFWLGTDHLGRDVLSRLIHGARVSLFVGITATAVGIGSGALIGISSGYIGGKFDLYVQRFYDAHAAIPGLILTLAIIAMLGQSLTAIIIGISVATFATGGRVIRASVFSVKEQDFVLAAHAMGSRALRIVWSHILPNIMAPILIIISARIGAAILTESSLAFLGFGVPPPAPSWGRMLSQEGRVYMLFQPWLSVWPGLVITIVVLSFNLFGDALRDVLDPRLRGSQR